MAISVHSPAERGWSLRHSVSDCTVRGGTAIVLPGDGGRAVFQPRMCQGVRHVSIDERHRSWTDHNDVHDRWLLCGDLVLGGEILRRLVSDSAAME